MKLTLDEKRFLTWIYNRLVNVHHENKNVNYMIRLKDMLESKKERAIQVPWKDAPRWANWRAMNDNGSWYWYENKPYIGESTIWVTDIGRREFFHSSLFMSDWENSCEARPVVDELIEKGISYEETFFKRSVELASLAAKMHSVNVYVTSMHAANVQRAHRGESLAYNEDSFVECAQQLEEIAERMLKL